ncbi:MAG: DUF6152 family protein [Gammaproteobacteria bacterium]|nr:DUF6152 family protein [Gammaproteobacteria bacterium]
MKQLFLGLGLSILLATPAIAHHNWAAFYDVKGDIEIEAVVSSITWRNPHVRMSFTVDAGTANEKVYTTESNSVASLARMGVTKELLTVGTKVRVAGYPNRSRDDDLFMNHLLLPGGREIVFLRTAEPRWPDAERIGNTDALHGRVVEEDFAKRPTSVFAVWSTIYGAKGSHMAIRHPDGEYSIDYGEQRGAGECVSKDLWTQMGAPYPIRLIDKGDTVIIHAEEYDTIRPVQLVADHNDPGTVKNNLGYSTGRWVGDTLVVITTFKGSNSPVQMHESFTLSPDHGRLNYSQIVINPESDNLPTVNAKWWGYVPDSFVQPYDCI